MSESTDLNSVSLIDSNLPLPLPRGATHIFSFWEGPKPAWIQLCHETMRRHNPTYVVYSYDTLPGYLHHYRDDPYFRRLCLAHQADIIRVEILKREGGLWLDSDFICLNSLQPLLDVAFRQHKFLFYNEQGGPTNGFLCAPPSHSFTIEWSRKIASVYANFKRHGRVVGMGEWTAFGHDQLKVLIPQALEPVQDVGWDRVQLIPFREWKRFFSTNSVKDHAWPGAYGYMLFNTSGIEPWFRTLSADEILKGPWLISYLFRLALGLEKHEDPQWTDTPPTSPSSPNSSLNASTPSS